MLLEVWTTRLNGVQVYVLLEYIFTGGLQLY